MKYNRTRTDSWIYLEPLHAVCHMLPFCYFCSPASLGIGNIIPIQVTETIQPGEPWRGLKGVTHELGMPLKRKGSFYSPSTRHISSFACLIPLVFGTIYSTHMVCLTLQYTRGSTIMRWWQCSY
ncbi:hypothetical protein F5146DRAFT_55077 [Armillaria mellea]|nr:hypothetical protein F5146DRAFT_55077 [Armillaria mellea]